MAITTGLFVAQWWAHEFHWGLFLGSCYTSLLVFVMVHNHNHVPMWKNATLNRIQDYWLTAFYGYPVFAWIPTHNRNHHARNNREGDDSITYRHTEANNLFSVLSYPLVSGGAQQQVNVRFIKALWKSDRPKALYYLSQLGFLVVFVAVALFINWKKALYAVVIPQQISLNGVLMINYIQHVHADEESRWNHSRNFTGRFTNWMILNNGYHTAHHERPLLHWSEYSRLHQEIADHVSPRLNEKSFFWYVVRVYFLSPFFPPLGTRSMRLERIAATGK
jgi:fatty acid desaturase